MNQVKTEGISTPIGNLQGSAGPGVLCLVLGTLWSYNTLFRYHVARRESILNGRDGKKLNYTNCLFSKYHAGCVQRAPVEEYAMLAFGIGSVVGGFVCLASGYPVNTTTQHIILFSFYLLIAIVAILQHRRHPLPPDSDYAVFAVANIIQAFMVIQQQTGKASLDELMHFILAGLNAMTVVCTAFEVLFRSSVTAALGRTVLQMAQGMWLCVTGTVAHPLPFMPQWDQEDHWQVDVVTSIGVGNLALVLVVVFVLNLIISTRVNHMNLATVSRILALTYEQNHVSTTKNDVEGFLSSDSDCET